MSKATLNNAQGVCVLNCALASYFEVNVIGDTHIADPLFAEEGKVYYIKVQGPGEYTGSNWPTVTFSAKWVISSSHIKPGSAESPKADDNWKPNAPESAVSYPTGKVMPFFFDQGLMVFNGNVGEAFEVPK